MFSAVMSFSMSNLACSSGKSKLLPSDRANWCLRFKPMDHHGSLTDEHFALPFFFFRFILSCSFRPPFCQEIGTMIWRTITHCMPYVAGLTRCLQARVNMSVPKCTKVKKKKTELNFYRLFTTHQKFTNFSIATVSKRKGQSPLEYQFSSVQ